MKPLQRLVGVDDCVLSLRAEQRDVLPSEARAAKHLLELLTHVESLNDSVVHSFFLLLLRWGSEFQVLYRAGPAPLGHCAGDVVYVYLQFGEKLVCAPNKSLRFF